MAPKSDEMKKRKLQSKLRIVRRNLKKIEKKQRKLSRRQRNLNKIDESKSRFADVERVLTSLSREDVSVLSTAGMHLPRVVKLHELCRDYDLHPLTEPSDEDDGKLPPSDEDDDELYVQSVRLMEQQVEAERAQAHEQMRLMALLCSSSAIEDEVD